MNILVTGGMGFIGQELVQSLLDDDHEVTIVDRWKDLVISYENSRLPIVESIYRTTQLCDLIEPYEFLSLKESRLKNFQMVVHAGACVDTTKIDSELFETNVSFTSDFIQKFDSLINPPKIVFISSASVYGSKGFPNNPYGMSKKIGENLFADYSGDYTMLRLFNVFGKNEHHKRHMSSLPFKLAESYRQGLRFEMHSPDAQRDFVPVETVVNAIKESFNSNYSDHVFDVGTGTPMSLRDLDYHVMIAMGKTESCVKEIPMPSHFEGRYQGYTCAGVNTKNIGIGSTIDAIRKIYGKNS